MSFEITLPPLRYDEDKIKFIYRENGAMSIHSIYDVLTYMQTLITLYQTEQPLCSLSHMYHLLHTVTLFLSQVVMAIVWQSIVEYYWHVMMHWPFFYKTMHKIHHSYKAPELFDDMYIHPLEATGYYLILYSPPFLPMLNIHIASFLAYMGIMGICGVLDHSGISMRIAGLYDTRDHDIHHLKTVVNYSFPFPFMDYLHNTYLSPETLKNREAIATAVGK